MRNNPTTRSVLAGFSLLLISMTAGCDSTTPEQHLERARGYLAEGEPRTAVIELKNALQKAPDLADARSLLGQTHLRMGDYPSALKELERALDLGLDNPTVRLALLQTKLRLGRSQEVIGELEPEGALEPAFAVVLAEAYLAGGATDKARTLFQQGLTLADGNLGLGTIAWAEGDLDRAGAYLDKAVEIDPQHRDGWLRLAEFQLVQQQYEVAATAFTTAASLPGGAVMGRTGLARVRLLERNLTQAATEIAEVLRLAPQFPLAHYLDGLIKYEQGDIDGAEAALREVQRTAPNHPPTLHLMGAVKFRQGQLSQAQDNLQRYLAQDPGNETAAKLLASVRFQQQDFDGVIDALAPFNLESRDPQLLAMYGSVQLRLGATAAAMDAFQRAVELAPDAAAFRNQLALSLLAAGEESRAEAELASAIEVDGEQFQSDYLIAMLRVREGDFEAARSAVEEIIRKSPEIPLGYNLRGAVALGLGDEAAAIAAFEEALRVDGAFFPAVRNLAGIAERAGDLDGAKARYQAMLESSPDNESALLALADLSARRQDMGAAEEFLSRAVAAQPRSLRARLGLTRVLLMQNEVSRAEQAVDGALSLVPRSADALLLRAEVDLRKGDPSAARQRASQLQAIAAEQSDNVPLLVALGVLQLRVNNLTLARSDFETALTSDTNNLVALRGLTRLELREGNAAAAVQQLQRLGDLGDSGPGFELLQADVAQARGDRDTAAKGYAALAAKGVRDGALRLGILRLAEGDLESATAGLNDWLENNENDLGARLLLADGLMRQEDKSAAIGQYERIVSSNNPVVLNNLAWLYMERGDARALPMARQAQEAAPNNADIADTLGWILVQNGEAKEGLVFLIQSVQLKPENGSAQYHLGVALRDTGDLAGARQALERAISAGSIPEIEEARSVLATLSDV